VSEALEIHVTMPDTSAAQSLARALVDEELAACVNIVVLCLIKTHPALFDRLRDRILALHPYDVPEILAFKVHDSSRAYIDWLHGSVAVTERKSE
jgi:periplasmic divalent cation tolerance protein